MRGWLSTFVAGALVGMLVVALPSPAGAQLDPVVSSEYPVSEPVYGNAGSDQSRPAVAFDGTNYLVAWTDHRSSTNESDIYATRVSPTGTVLDSAGIAVSTAAGEQYLPSVAFDGADYLVAWSDGRSRGETGTDIYATRVSSTGTVTDSAGIAVSTAGGEQDSPAIGFDGANYLLAWSDGRSSFETGTDIYSTRMSPAGAVADPAGIAVSSAPGDQYWPGIGFNGSNYLAVWSDGRSRFETGTDIYSTRVGPSGAVADPNGIAVSTAVGDQDGPAVVSDAPTTSSHGVRRTPLREPRISREPG